MDRSHRGGVTVGAGMGLLPAVGEARWLKWCSVLGAPGVSAVLHSARGGVLLLPLLAVASVVVGAAGAPQRAGGCVGTAHSGVRCQGGVWLGVRRLVVVYYFLFACFVSACFVRLTLLSFCSVFMVLALCCCVSSCAAAGDDLLRSCRKCFCTCNLVDVADTHTRSFSSCLGIWDFWGPNSTSSVIF